MTDEPLPTLIDAARARRVGAFERLVARIEDQVRRWARRLTDDADEADDVTQDVLIILERRVHQFAGDSQLSTWLYRVTKNTALQRMRRDARRADRLRRRGIDPASMQVEQEEQTDERTLARLVEKYFTELPDRQREIFELADLRGLSSAEIAERLGVEAVTVRTNLFKARRTIRQRILEQHPKLLEEYLS